MYEFMEKMISNLSLAEITFYSTAKELDSIFHK